MVTCLEFLAPSLHPNTLLDISIPEPGPSSLDPIVRILPIKYKSEHGEYKSVGTIKRLSSNPDGNIVVADDQFRVSSLYINEDGDHRLSKPEVVTQHKINGRAGDTWTGMIRVGAGNISSLSSGLLTFHPPSAHDDQTPKSRTISGPVLALASNGRDAKTFALAGKEVDVSIWDVERTFASTSLGASTSGGSKRKKGELEAGEIWCAKNMSNNSLGLRPPNHHLSLAHLTRIGPNHLVSGTKSGTIRRYDTRQRKPTNEWKVAREGGVGAIAEGGNEHEVFFADRANLLGAVDLRTGRLLYSYPGQTCTTHHILAPELDKPSYPGTIGLATISSDATLRIHSTLPPKADGEKGNVGAGKKAKVEGMVGGVGISTIQYRGTSEIEQVVTKSTKDGAGDEGDDDEEGDEEESGDEEIWEGMSEVEDDGEDTDDESEDEVAPPAKSKRSKQKK